MGRGKIERVFETIQQQFLVEVAGDDAASRPGTRSSAWTSSTACSTPGSAPSTTPGRTPRPGKPRRPAGTPPGQPRLPDPALLKAAFSWSVIRQVRKTATVSVEGNVYSVDPFLSAGRSSASSTRST